MTDERSSHDSVRPYRDSVDHLRAELARLDILLRHRLEAWWAETEGVQDGLQSLYVSDDEVDRLLDLTDGADGAARDAGQPTSHRSIALEQATDELSRRSRLPAPGAEDLRFRALATRFGLDRVACDLLLVALAPELDAKYERIYGYLQDDITKTRPTVGFALRLLAQAHDDAEPLRRRELLGARSSMRRHGLVSLPSGGDRPFPSRTLHVDDRITGFVLGSDAVDGRLDGVEPRRPTRTLDDLVVDGPTRQRLARLTTTLWERGGTADSGDVDDLDRRPAVVLSGPDGVGRDAAVEVLCASVDEVLVADLGIVDGPVDADWVDLLVREARLRDVPLFVRNVPPTPVPGDGESDSQLATLLRGVDAYDGPLFFSTTDALPTRERGALATHDLVAVDLPKPGYDTQRAYWATFDLPSDVDSAVLASTFSLTPGEISAAVRAARREARMTGTTLSKDIVYRCCRERTTDLIGSLARPISPTYGWDDIVLPGDRLTHLREVAAHVKHRGTVYTEWGFEGKFSLGNGLVVLFTGPSGTGKTMAAEIIAADAGLDLYKIDLASVVSKYIGETEKNLGRLFDEAEGGNVVLLFDEADALFGKRSEVSDAHDRYANIEVNYLLQRIEEHDGTVLLTTNFKRNIDEAFLRRIHLSVDFPMPDERSRAAIWETIFPPETPVDALDVAFLSGFELSGGSIKNIALTGAFIAADEGEVVGMRHVVRALARELQKSGRVVRPDEFGRYQGYLSP